jgi:anti-anti-sigma factor
VDGTLHVSRLVNDWAVVVRVIGEIDANTAPHLHESLRQASALVKPPKLVVADLGEVTFLASAGLSVLVETHERCRDQHTPLQVVVTAHAPLRALRVTGLDRILHVVGGLERPGPHGMVERSRSA